MGSPILAIDPGPEKSAWIVIEHGEPAEWCISDNEATLIQCQHSGCPVVIEQVASYGMPVGAEVFETVFWSGRFAEAANWSGVRFHRLTRGDVKMHLCHTMKGVNDSVIRQALIDRFGPGKEAAIGTKNKPGPLYGIKADVWQALALGVTWLDKQAGVVAL